MTFLRSPEALFVLIVLIVPFIWSAVVHLSRGLATRGASVSDGQERMILGLMLAPVLFGLMSILMPGLLPSLPSPLPPIGEPIGIGGLEGAGAIEGTVASMRIAPLLWQAIIAAYGAGTLIFIGRLLLSYQRVRKIMRGSIGRDAKGDVRVTAEAVPPFATSCGRVILPGSYARIADEEETSLIIAHERAHIARRDPHWFLALAAIESFFWFNPFIRLQTSYCRLAAELDCDARVLKAAPQMRKAYANTLVRVLKHTAGAAPICAPAALSHRTKGDIRVRLTDIMQAKSKRQNRGAKAVLAALGLFLVPLSTWQLAHASSADFTVRPVEGVLSSSYGERIHPITKKPKMHKGTDIAAPLGTPIYAPAGGKVLRIMMSDTGYGNMLEIDHGEGVVTRYGQLDSIAADGKKTVRAGDLIARVGASGQATGPHLHIEVIVNGKHVDPETVLDLPETKKKPPHEH